MRINDFYSIGQCDTLAKIQGTIHEDGRFLAFNSAVRGFINHMENGNALEKFGDELRRTYDKSWFPFQWQYENAIRTDTALMKRFLDWIGDVTVVGTELSVSITEPELTDRVPLVVKFPNGRYSAIFLFNRKADKSLRGKSVHTAVATDLHAMAAKYSLEEKYPGIIINLVYLRSELDTDEVLQPAFTISDTKKSNVFTLDFSGYYKSGVFQKETLLETIRSVAAQAVEKDCHNCYCRQLCGVSGLDHSAAPETAGEKTTVYRMPAFTDAQQRVINHIDGPLLVCAGPGSGKTATLVGRVKNLIGRGIPAEFILLITFTNEAARELETRCRSFCGEDALPRISTLNALGYEILRNHKELLGGKIDLLTQAQQMEIVKSLLSVFPKISGLNYGSEYGRNGLYKTAVSKIAAYLSAESKEAFFFKEKKLGTDFIPFAEQYKAIVKEKGYIDFDQQVSLCLDLFREHPEILGIYQNIYKYVMVDEFQDINADNAALIYQVAAHGNLVVVGDDDQGIYGFRGGSNQYMLSFPDVFKGAQTVVLEENFRSVEPIVTSAQQLIANNQTRIGKKITSTRAGDAKPVLMPDMSGESIGQAVKEVLEDGYSYEDIAIISTKNLPLENLHKSLPLPTVLAKAYLRNDSFFRVLYDVLSLYRNRADDKAFYHYMQVFGEDVPPVYGKTLLEAFMASKGVETLGECQAGKNSPLSILADLFHLLDATDKAGAFIENAAYVLGMENTVSSKAVSDMAETNHLSSIQAFHEYMEYMVLFGDETRIAVNSSGKILLITSHESKGREFPVVLLLNDFSDKTDESRRLFYVAMTRAKDRLYILPDNSGKDSFLSELPDMERRTI